MSGLNVTVPNTNTNNKTLLTGSSSGTALLELEVEVNATDKNQTKAKAKAKAKDGGRGKSRIAPNENKDVIFLGSLTPSPGSYRDALRIVESGTLTFDPEKLVIAFYREMVERKPQTGLLEVKSEYQPTETVVYPDSSIYGELEPNLTFHAEVLTAHYQILNNEQRWLIEQHLVENKSYASLSATAGRHASYLSRKFLIGISKVVRYVYRDYNVSTYQPISNLLCGGVSD